jgi:ribose-phosphate pyrophosphokinase
VLTLELHAGQIQGFFDIPTDNLFSTPVLERDIRETHKDVGQLMIISPDVGGVIRARALANRLGSDLAIVDKRRPKAGESEVMNIIGEVKGRDCILVDDIVDSGGTLCNAAEALLKDGAKSVSAYITHGVLSNGAVKRIDESKLKELVVTNSIDPKTRKMGSKKIRDVSVAALMGDAIWRIANEQSVSSLFE